MKIAQLVKWAITEGCFEGCDLDGGILQDKAVKAGVLIETKYDPAKHGPSDGDVDEGDRWYVFSDEFKAALSLEK